MRYLDNGVPLYESSLTNDSELWTACASHSSAVILEQSMGARNRVGKGLSYPPARDCIFKLLRSPEIDSKEAIPPAYSIYEVSWRAGTTTLFLLGS